MGLISAVTVPRATSPAGSVAVLTLGLANTRDCPDVFIFAWGMGVKCFVTVLLIDLLKGQQTTSVGSCWELLT